MKYLGNKSLSSVVERILQVSWFLVLFGSIMAALFVTLFLFTPSVENPAASKLAQIQSEIYQELEEENDKDWQEFKDVPPEGKIFILPYLAVITVLLLRILKNGRYIFRNFKNNLVFHESNVLQISKTSKLLIWFSVLTFNFASLLVSIILLILSDIFKNGAALQEEYDLTV